MLNADKCFVSPRASEAAEVAGWIKYQGNARGFFVGEELVVFHSYGNTHDSMRRHLKAQINTCFVIQGNGDVLLVEDCWETMPILEAGFTSEQTGFFSRLAKLLGNNWPEIRSL